MSSIRSQDQFKRFKWNRTFLNLSMNATFKRDILISILCRILHEREGNILYFIYIIRIHKSDKLINLTLPGSCLTITVIYVTYHRFRINKC